MSNITRYQSNERLSRVVVINGIAYFSGLTASDRGGDIANQTKQIFDKADSLLAEIGSDRSRILDALIWLRDIGDFVAMNAVWEKWIDPEAPPARATVESKLAAQDVRIEIKFIVAAGHWTSK